MTLPQFPFARDYAYFPPKINGKLRHEWPASKVRLYDNNEAWILMKHKDICAALSSDDLSADRRTPGYPEIHSGGHRAKEAEPTFVNLDESGHRKQRNMLEDAFTPNAVKALEPMIQETVEKVLVQFRQNYEKNDRQPIDLIENVAAPIPTQIIYSLLGVPDEDIEELSKDSSVRTGTSREAAETANKDLQDYMGKLVDSRIDRPRNDLISKLVVEQYREKQLSRDSIVSLALLVLTAGNAALINSIGLGVVTLLRHPSQLNEFKQNPELAPQVVNELLRYNTASALNSRRAALRDTHIGRATIKKGEGIICSVQSGDRDEDKTLDPESFDIHRSYRPNDVLGFGYGPHRCQGEALSRMELETVFTALFQKFPNMKLVTALEELEYTPPTQNIGVLALPVSLH